MDELARRRNVAFIGPHHAGKTALAHALLAQCGARTQEAQSGDRAQANTHFFFASLPHLLLHLIDTPGYVDFQEEAKLALLAADAAVVVVEAEPSRVKQARALVEAIEERKLPHCFFMNKLDRPGSDFHTTYRELKAIFGAHIVAEQLPIGEAEEFRGFIDLVAQHAYLFTDGDGGGAREVALAAELRAPTQDARAKLLEALGDLDDRILEELLEGAEPSLDEIRADLREETKRDRFVPLLAGSAAHGRGVAALLELIAEQFPPPGGDAKAPLAAQVCKTTLHPQSGKLSIARILSGSLNSDAQLVDVSRGGLKARAAGLYRMHGHKQEPLPAAQAGDIVAIARLEGVHTGDTLTIQSSGVAALPVPTLEEPFFAVAIAPKEKLDESKLSQALARMCEEDPTLRVTRAEFTGELQLHGLGDVHVTTALQRLERTYHIALEMREPSIAYRETIAQAAQTHARYKHQTGGHGQFGDVTLRIEPRERGHGVSFEERIVGGVVPRQFFPAVEKGVREALMRGPIAGHPVVDVHVVLIDGAHHPVDSSEQSFKMAASAAIREGLPKCGPLLLEPILSVELSIPEESAAAVLGSITAKRGHVCAFEPGDKKGFQRLRALAPQAELGNYITELRTATGGLGTYTWKHERFDIAPAKAGVGLW